MNLLQRHVNWIDRMVTPKWVQVVVLSLVAAGAVHLVYRWWTDPSMLFRDPKILFGMAIMGSAWLTAWLVKKFVKDK